MAPTNTEKLLGARLRGRGADWNPPIRFLKHCHEAVDDGWDTDDALPNLRRQVVDEAARTVLSYNRSPDLPFDRSVNPYRGCEHGCIYCYARPSHAYLSLSPGVDFETRLFAKPDAPALLEKALRKPGYKPAVIAFGTNTDPYQPIEKERKIMRGCLEVLRAFQHPVAIITKGSLIERDIDILAPMADRNLVRVGVSVTTLDRKLSRKLEPRVPDPNRRLSALESLSRSGIPTRVMVAPVIPALTDHELEAILESAHRAGAQTASYILLRLPREVAPLFQGWLETHVPDRASRVLNQMALYHGGALYDADFGSRMRGSGTLAELLRARFSSALRRFGLSAKAPPLDCDAFVVPPKVGDQLSLF